MTLLEALKAIRDHGPTYPEEGICRNVRVRGADTWEFLNLAWKWPERSGRMVYPVKHPDTTAALGYLDAPAGEMWSPDHPYGAARLRLLNWCIETLEAKQDGT